MNPDLAAAFDRIDSLLDVDPAHKDRMDRWEHGDFNDTDNTPALAGSDRTILIEQLRYAREALYELRHSPHLWRTHARLRHPGERVDPDPCGSLRTQIAALPVMLNVGDDGEPLISREAVLELIGEEPPTRRQEMAGRGRGKLGMGAKYR